MFASLNSIGDISECNHSVYSQYWPNMSTSAYMYHAGGLMGSQEHDYQVHCELYCYCVCMLCNNTGSDFVSGIPLHC